MLLNDQQFAFERGKISTYSEIVYKIQNPQGLAAGNVSIVWQPATDTVTVNKLEIHRGDKVIDALSSGQTFTILRRETNLDAATLDGTLTGNIQPEGLQEGDIIDFATTTEHADPVLKGHVEAIFAGWNNLPVQSARAVANWPAGLTMTFRQSAFLPSATRSTNKGVNQLSLSATDIEPVVTPKGAPARFGVARMAELTDFASWNDLAALFIPLFREASAISTSGTLHDEAEKIRLSTTDPKQRAEQALALVQDRIRYVALLMGQGGYLPAPAETTWSRRFGDCKAKTALLLGLLHELGIDAEPVLVQSQLGDIVADRLPMVELFDHVIVRAHIGAKDYWLDGTRTGDKDLDSIQIPDFGWALPLVANAQLVHLVPRPLDAPELQGQLDIDLSAGVYAPAPATAEQVVDGDAAVELQSRLASLSKDQLDEFMRAYWTSKYDFLTYKSGAFTFDKDKRQLRITGSGDAKLDWSGGYFHVPESSVGYHPNFERKAGPLHDAPFAIAYPVYNKNVIRLRMPPSFIEGRKAGSVDVNETVAGVEYKRSSAISGNTLIFETSARSLVPEISYKEAKAAEPRLLELDQEDAELPIAARYKLTDADIAAKQSETPTSADGYVKRANLFLDYSKFDAAIADYSEALKLRPNDEQSLAGRGLAYVWKRNFEDATKDLAAAKAKDPDDPVALRALGLMASFQNDCAKSIDYFTQSLVKDAGNAFALGHRAICENAKSKSDAALADSAEALKSDPNWIDLRMLRANIFFTRSANTAAGQEADLLVQQNPNSDYAMVGAARIYSKIGKQAEALKAFDRALAIKPAAYVYLNRAQTRPFTDKKGRLADLDAALKLEPDNPDVLAEKAEQLAADGNYKQALELYGQISKTDELASFYNLRRAVLMYKAGQVAEAGKLFAEERSKAKTASDFNRLCWEKATAGILLNEAIEDCRQSLKLTPDAAGSIDSLAFVELRLGKVDDAIADYSRAIAMNSGSASYMGRAIAYSRKGDKTRSDADLHEALRLDENARTRFEEFGMTLAQSPGSAIPMAAKP